MSDFDPKQHVIRWPRELVKQEIERELGRLTPDWERRISFILDDAFEDGDLYIQWQRLDSSLFSPSWGQTKAISHQAQEFLTEIIDALAEFPEVRRRKKLYSERKNEGTRNIFSRPNLPAQIQKAIESLIRRGYFTQLIGHDCPDMNECDQQSAEQIIEEYAPGRHLWPLHFDPWSNLIQDDAFDLVEILDDLVAAPTLRSWHNFGEPHWDSMEFSKARGQAVFRWEINLALEHCGSSLRIATSGKDAGLIVKQTEPNFDALVQKVKTTPQKDDLQRVESALAQMRKRDGNEADKRAACATLASVLESRRNIIKEELLKKDERDLFYIANEFDIRHKSEKQKGNYDPIFFEWIFWWYLATIELTNRMIERKGMV